jgi:hypothetical protein
MSGASPSPASAEVCDLCGAALIESHPHLLDAANRKLECACEACAILFSGDHQRRRRIPRRIRFLPDFRMTDAEWDSLGIPIGVAFVYRNSASDRVVALYPSPAGPVESLLTMDAWVDICRENPSLSGMEPDVEGLLAYRVGTAREHYIIPVDECFKLIGTIRIHWKGFSGGMAMWQEVGKFLEGLKHRSSR